MIKAKNLRKINLAEQWRWLAPLVAVLSIFGWIYLFQGLAPQKAIDYNGYQFRQTTWASVTPGGVINFLAYTGFYIVIPELIIFQPLIKLKIWKQQWRKTTLIAVCLLLCFFLFPPKLIGWLMVKWLPNDTFIMASVYYSLSLLACVRFSQPNLMSLIVLFNCLLGIKAGLWGKYLVPLAVVFWYLKSVGLEDKFNILDKRTYEVNRE